MSSKISLGYMDYLLAIFVVVIGYVLLQLDKRVGRTEKSVAGIDKSIGIEEKRFSWSFDVDARRAVMTTPLFRKLPGVYSAEAGNNDDTSRKQRSLQRNRLEQIATRSHFYITYLSKEDAFFTHPPDSNPRFVFSNGSDKVIYQETLIENKNKDTVGFGDGESLTICARDRYLVLDKKTLTRIRVLTIYLLEGVDRRENYTILCDFPFITPDIADENKLLGFEVHHSNGDVYKTEGRPFGPIPGYSKGPDVTTWRKNGVEITYIDMGDN